MRGQTADRSWAVHGVGAVSALVVAWLVWTRVDLVGWIDDGGPVPFFTAVAILPAIGVPLTPLLLLAGATFGRWTALAGSLTALALNLTLCFAIARTLRPRLVALLRRYGRELPHFERRRRGAVRFTLAAKSAPGVPAFLKNYLLGLSGVPFGIYFWLSMAVTGAYAAALVLLGESLLHHRALRVAAAAALLAVVAVAILRWRRRRGLPADPSARAA